MSSVSIARQRGLYSSVTDQELPQVRRDISQLREQISSGTRINRPSDDPTDHAVAEEMGRLDNEIDRRLSSIGDAQSFVARTQQELGALGDLFAQAKEKGLQAANDSVSDDDRKAIAKEIEAIQDEVTDRMNARHQGEYLFGGTRTQTQPFNENHSGGIVGAGTFNDITGGRTVSVGQDKSIRYNISGKELGRIGSTDVDKSLQHLKRAVHPGKSPSDPALPANDVQAVLDRVDRSREHVIGKASKAGTISNRLSAAKDQLETTQINVRERQSDVQDTDVAQAATELQKKQTQLQASLKAVASTQQQASLVNFL